MRTIEKASSLTLLSALVATGLGSVLVLSAAATAQAAIGVLENPAAGSSQSGITVISGWVCDAQTVTLTVDGTLELEAAYGTPRSDTLGVCGDTNNGFGLLWNFNLFGAGAHTIVAKADGVEFGSATFAVTTLGAPFEPAFAGSFGINNFPTAGNAFNLLWQTGSQNFVIAPAGTSATASADALSSVDGDAEQPTAATGVLENPGAFVSGIWLFSGWVCAAQQVTLRIDGTQELIAAYGTPRGDTEGVCGDTDNGFGLLWNFNLFGGGQHTVEAFADGMKFGERTFTVTGFGTNFLRNASGSFRLIGFPAGLEDTFVRWVQSAQNFAIWAKTPTGAPTPGGPTPTPTPTPGGSAVCGNGIIEPGEQCDGSNLNGYNCATAYGGSEFGGECFGDPLACDSDCTFNAENEDACICSCEDDLDCGFPDDPQGRTPPLGVDCTLLWCNKGVCPCNHLAEDGAFVECIDLNTDETTQPNQAIRDACERFAACVDDVACFIGSDRAFQYVFSTQTGICGEAQPGFCDTNPAAYTATPELRQEICTSRDPSDASVFRCDAYCDACDCTNPSNLRPYDPDAGECL